MIEFFTNYWPYIVIGVAVIAVLIVVLSLTVFKKSHLKKQVRELNNRFEFLHATLTGQDAQFIKRLELISRTNLLYVDIHIKYNKQFKEICNNLDADTQGLVNEAKDLLMDKQYKKLKSSLSKTKQSIESYGNEVNRLDKELLSILQPEEDCRASSLVLKDKVRDLKQQYFNKSADLALLAESFDVLFANLEKCFNSFETNVESAQYDDAKKQLNDIGKVVNELNKIFPLLPDICTSLTNIIPAKTKALKEKYSDLEAQEMPLAHLMVINSIQEIESETEYITKCVKQFNLNGINERLDAILRRFDDYDKSFETEESAKKTFDAEYETVYRIDQDIEKKYIDLCNALPEIKSVYVISDIQLANIADLKTQINKNGITKRTLDTFTHSTTHQPYSILLAKLHQLKDEATACDAQLTDFNNYLNSLKRDSEEGYKTIVKVQEELKQRETVLKDSQIENFQNKYLPLIEEIYKLVDTCYSILSVTPIDVAEIDKLVEEINNKTSYVIAEVDKNETLRKQAEEAIAYANRDRMHLGDLHQIIKQTETMYFNGDFENALIETNKVLDSIRSGEK